MIAHVTLAAGMLFTTTAAAAARDPVTATKPSAKASEPRWYAVEDLVADAGVAEIAVVPQAPAVAASETYYYVLVRGVVPFDEQRREFSRTRAANENAEFVDFEIERQVESTQGSGERLGWKRVDLKTIHEVLNKTPAFAHDVVSPSVTNPVFTAPLPERSRGDWRHASHPRLASEAEGEVLLFRYPDFDVKPGQRYRYRVRLECLNPHYQREADVVHPDVAAGQTRWTEWSEPTDWIAVRENGRRESDLVD